MKIAIYQVRMDIDERHDISYMSYKEATKVISEDALKSNLNKYYEKKYEFEKDYNNLSSNEILEDLFFIFNMARPEDFKGHSLSTSDIVVLDGKSTYFCDSFGWQEVA